MDDTTVQAPQAVAAAPALREIAELPGPRRVPVLGNAMQIEASRFHRQLEAWADRFGPLYGLRLGPRPVLVVADHQEVMRILRDRPDGFRRSERLAEIGAELGLLPGVFSANGEEWRKQRRMVMASFDPAHVKHYYPSMQKVAQRLAGRWRRAASANQPIDLQADLMRFTVDTIAGLAFGADVNTLEDDGDVIQRHLDKIFPVLFKRIVATFPTWRWFKTPADRQVERSMIEVKRAVAGFVAQARANIATQPERRAHPTNLLEAMIVAADEPGSGIDDDTVAGNVLTMLLAGEDTTANTLAWMIHLLWRHPSALRRAVEEVRAVCVGDGAPTLEQLGRLDFVEACAHETMRLKPVGPFLGLQALRDTTVADVRVPSGTLVMVLFRHDSVSDRYLPRAAAFEPQRWLDGGDGIPGTGPAGQAEAAGAARGAAGAEGAGAAAGAAGGHPAVASAAAGHLGAAASPKRLSMPFGGGARMCPGRYLALTEIKLAMATLLTQFDIVGVDTPDGMEAREHLAFTMTPVGLKMRLARRNSAVRRVR